MGVYLSKPNTTKDTGNGESDVLRYGHSSMQGWRTGMEDAHIDTLNVKDGVHLFAVFDGHGGPEVAKFCALNFVPHLKQNKNFQEGKYKEALEEIFLKMDEILLSAEGEKQLRQWKRDSESKSMAGCTANVCLISPTEVYCANAGDSRTIVFDADGTVVPLSHDHKPDVPAEKERILAANGYVSEGRVNDNLNLTRAIGDLEYKRNPALKPKDQIISAFPEVAVYPLTKKPKFLLMGCDGIWETLKAEEICKMLNDKLTPTVKISSILDELLDKLMAKDTTDGQGCDNMTSILIQFKEALPSGKA